VRSDAAPDVITGFTVQKFFAKIASGERLAVPDQKES
jgi:hypothetical protein